MKSCLQLVQNFNLRWENYNFFYIGESYETEIVNLITDNENYIKNLSQQDLKIKNVEDEIRSKLTRNDVTKNTGNDLLIDIYNEVTDIFIGIILC